ncbi:MAG: PAS domain S-box protein [Solidesulfovibrio sp. DCME]|uniref:PAS domain S-box protein n=1 Tax=Solidesulfovibrio sp. DCME TaxID=3447380 RepID=UPI003D0DC3B4
MREVHPFGRRIREKRLALLATDPAYSLRQLATRLGIQPSYLSRLERGASPSLSEGHILALAAELGESPDTLLALAGKIPADVRQALLARPEAILPLVRELAALPEPGLSPWHDLRTLASSFRETQRLARVGSFTRDLGTGQDFWSEEFQRIFGLPPGSPIPTYDAFLTLVHPDDQPTVAAVRRRLLVGKGLQRYTYRFRRADGLWRYGKAVARAERDASGQVTRIHGTVQDVTSERQAQENLRSMARFPEDNPHPVLRLAPDGRLAYANPASAPLLRALGMTVGEPVPPPLAEAALLARETGAIRRIDIPLDAAVLEITLCPLPDSDAVNAYGRDVTRQRCPLPEAQTEDSRYRQFFDDAGLGLFHSTPDGRILWVNQATARLFGYVTPRDMIEAIGQSAAKVFLDPDKRAALVGQLRRASGPLRLEAVNVRRDGSTFTGRICVRLVKHAGQAVVEGFIEDITEHKRMEAALAAREERLQTHLRNFPLPSLTFALKDRELVLVDANKAAEALFRGRIGTCLEAPAGAIFDDAPDVYLALWNAFEARRTSRKRLAFRPPGAPEPGIFDMTFVFAAPDTVMLHAEDVTALAKAQEEIASSARELRTILDHVPYAASLVGADGRTLFLNKAFVDIVGYTARDIPDAQAWLEKAYPDPELRARVAADWQTAVGRPGSRVFPVRCGDGSDRNMEFTAVPLPDGKMLLTMRLADGPPIA